MPLTKVNTLVIDIDQVSDSLANETGNPGGLIEYITNQLDIVKNASDAYTDAAIVSVNNAISTINTKLTGVTASGQILLKSGNLAGLSDVSAAKSNLGLVNASSSVAGLTTLSSAANVSSDFGPSGNSSIAATPKDVYSYVQNSVYAPLSSSITSNAVSTVLTNSDLAAGRVVFPGGLIMQFGCASFLTTLDGVVSVTFPSPFPNYIYGCSLSPQGGGTASHSSDGKLARVDSLTKTGFNIHIGALTSGDVVYTAQAFWIAFGK